MEAGTESMTNEELIERLHAAGENPQEAKAIMAELWERNKRLINRIIHDLTGLEYDSPGFEDMQQQAYLGFHDAAHSFDKEAGCRFTSYAGNCVKWELCRYYDQTGSAIHIPEGMKQRIRSCKKKRDEMETERGRKVSDREALAAMGLPPAATATTLAAMNRLETASLEAEAAGSGEDDRSLLERLASGEDVEETVLEQEWQKELRIVLSKALMEVPEDTRVVICRRYFSRASLKRLAETRGITEQALHGRIEAAFRTIRQGEYGEELSEFLPTMSEYRRARRMIEYDRRELERIQLTEAERGMLAL